MTGQRKLQSASQAVPAHDRNPGLLHALDRRKHAQSLVENGLDAAHPAHALGQLLEVHADGEMLISGAPEDDRVDGLVGCQRGGLRLKLVHQLQAQPVSRRVVDGDRDHRAVLLQEEWRLFAS